jgi:hypothetical protein
MSKKKRRDVLFVTSLLLAPPLIALIGHQRRPWQLMQLDIAMLPALEMLAIGAT